MSPFVRGTGSSLQNKDLVFCAPQASFLSMLPTQEFDQKLIQGEITV